MSSARTLQKGKFQFSVAPGAYGAATSAGTAFLPQIDLQGRFGVTDNFELGVKAWLVGAALDGKIGLLRPSDPNSGINLSIDPGLGYVGISGSSGGSGGSLSVLQFYLPVLLGIRFGGHELILGPKVVDMLVLGASASSGGTTSSSGTANLLFVGSSIGFAIKAGDSFRILPEASFIYPVVGTAGGVGTTGLGGGALIQFGVGFLFGGGEDAPAPYMGDGNTGEVPPPPPPSTNL